MGAGVDPLAAQWPLFAVVPSLLAALALPFLHPQRNDVGPGRGTLDRALLGVVLALAHWILIGYSIAFGPDAWAGLFGEPGRHFAFDQVSHSAVQGEVRGPSFAFALQQMALAAMPLALLLGVFADRIRFGVSIVFALFWSALVYGPVAHWVWGGGLLSAPFLSTLAGAGAIDTTGGAVVHLSAGASALALTLVLGPRQRSQQEPDRESGAWILPLAGGAFFLGALGLAAGVAPVGSASSAVAATLAAGAGGAVGWMLVEWFHKGNVTESRLALGLAAGTIGVAPVAGGVGAPAALLLGSVAGVVVCVSLHILGRRLNPLNASVVGLHGVGGATGTVLAGVFCRNDLNPAARDGLLLGVGEQLTAQAIAVALIAAYAFGATWALARLLRFTTGDVVER